MAIDGQVEMDSNMKSCEIGKKKIVKLVKLVCSFFDNSLESVPLVI